MNTIWIYGIVASYILLVGVIYFSYRHFRDQIRKQEAYIQELAESNTNLQMKLENKQRRRAFRLELPEQKCEFEFIEFGDQKLERLKHRKGEGILKDVSRSGLQLICQVDLPVRKEIFLNLHFKLKEEEFTFKGKIIRKEEHLQYISYGIQFIEVKSAEEQRLVRIINQIELEKRNPI